MKNTRIVVLMALLVFFFIEGINEWEVVTIAKKPLASTVFGYLFVK